MLRRFTSVLFEFLETVLTSVFILVVVYVFIAFPVMVQGRSMEPNLYTGDRLLVETITSKLFGYQRGEVVVLSAYASGVAGLANELLVKRVIGLPGDRIKIYNCKVHIFKDGEIFEIVEAEYLPQGVCTIGGRFAAVKALLNSESSMAQRAKIQRILRSSLPQAVSISRMVASSKVPT